MRKTKFRRVDINYKIKTSLQRYIPGVKFQRGFVNIVESKKIL